MSPDRTAHASAADPDAPRQAGTPAPWLYVLKRAVRAFGLNGGSDLAASLTYFSVLALFPGLVAFVSVLALLGQDDTVSEGMLQIAAQLLPASTFETLEGPIRSLLDAPGAGFGLVIGLAGAIWSAAGYLRGFTRAMNRVYAVPEGRPALVLQPTVLGLTILALTTVVLIAMMLVLSGGVVKAIGDVAGLGDQTVLVWNIAKWPVMVALAAALIAVMYHAAPNVRKPRFRVLTVGAVSTLVVASLATGGFFLYVANFGSYNATYGSLAGVVIFLLWIHLMNTVLILGAEIDAEIMRIRQLGAGIHAERDLLLPLKSDAQIRKAADQTALEVLGARKLRRSMAARNDTTTRAAAIERAAAAASTEQRHR